MNRALISITQWYYILARYAVTAFGFFSSTNFSGYFSFRIRSYSRLSLVRELQKDHLINSKSIFSSQPTVMDSLVLC